MARTKTEYVCQQCGARAPKWMGRCPDCGEWNTLVETVDRPTTPAARRANRSGGPVPRPLSEVEHADQDRIVLEMGEVNRVLGGGLVRGSMILVGGDPGIGKSTLLMQVAAD